MNSTNINIIQNQRTYIQRYEPRKRAFGNFSSTFCQHGHILKTVCNQNSLEYCKRCMKCSRIEITHQNPSKLWTIARQAIRIPFSIPAVKTSDVRTKSSNMFSKEIFAISVFAQSFSSNLRVPIKYFSVKFNDSSSVPQLSTVSAPSKSHFE